MSSKIFMLLVLIALLLVLSVQGINKTEEKVPVQARSSEEKLSINVDKTITHQSSVPPVESINNTTKASPANVTNGLNATTGQTTISTYPSTPKSTTIIASVTSNVTTAANKTIISSTLPPVHILNSSTSVIPPQTLSTKSPNEDISTSTMPSTLKTSDNSTPLPPNRQFDGPSFIGGIVLTIGLTAIGFIAFKFYKADRAVKSENYRKL